MVTEFLSKEFKTYGAAWAVNHAISTLSSVLNFTSDLAISDLPLVRGFRQGANVLRPTKPVSIIFNYVKGLGPNSALDDETLRSKLIILLRIDLLARTSDLERLRWSEINFHSDYFECRIYRPKEWRGEGKTSVGEFSPWLKVDNYKGDPTICSVVALREWSTRTDRSWIKSNASTVFWIRSKRQVRSMRSSELAKISLGVMRAAGVPDEFKSQSMRGAAASAALDYQVPIKVILRQGRWSNQSLSRKYYYRQVPREGLDKLKKCSLVEALRFGCKYLST